MIGRAEVIAGVSPRALRSYHGGAYVGAERRARGGGPRLPRPARRALRGAARGDANGAVERPPAAPPPRPAARATGSCAGRPSSTTSSSAAPGIARDDERRYAVSLLDAILGGSASSRLFQEIREKRGMAYSVYSYGSQYAETGQVGVYVGTREDNLDECLAVTAAELRDVAAGNLRAGRARAREGEPRGPAAALAREHVEPDDAAREGARHGLRARLARGDDPARPRRSPRPTSRRPRASSTRRSGSPRRASGRARAGSAPRVARINPALAERS